MRNKPCIGSSNLLRVAFLFPLLLASCAAAPQRMTEVALVGDSAALDELLRAGAGDVNQAYPVGKNQAACPGETFLTPLQAASCAGHASVVKKLLDNKANPDLATRAGRKVPLFLALDNGREDIVRLLVEGGANPDIGDSGGNTALMVAARKGNSSLAGFLLKHGASTKLVNRDGETALMQASDLNMAKMLVNQGADPFQKSARGESPLQVATQKGNAETAGYFRELEEQSRRELDQEMAAGDLAVQNGRFDEARPHYSAAIAKASGLGGPAAMNARVRILKTVNGLPDPPGLSDKAREHLVRSSYILKNSQNFDQAEKEVAAAILADPWWLDGYYNIGILQAKLNRFAIAEENLAIYIAAAPPGPKTQGAQDKIYEIRLAREEADKISGVSGQWKDGSGAGYSVAIDGSHLQIQSPGGLKFALTINNNVLKGSVEGPASAGPNGCTFPGQIHPVNGKLDPDANGMSLEYLWSKYDTKFHYVNMFGAPVAGNCLTCDTKCDAVNIIATNTVNLRLVRVGGAPKSGGPAGARPSVERTIADPSMRNLRRGN